MAIASRDAVKQLSALIEEVDEPLKSTFQNMHQGHPNETLVRFLKAREWNVSKAYKLLVDCLNWRLENKIDDILSKPIIPTDFYRAVRDSQLIGLSGYSKEGLPVFAIGVGLSTFDKASVHYYVQSHIQINEYRDRVVLPAATQKHGRHIGTCIKVLDMTGLKLSALSQLKLLTMISTVDDLNYPEKTETYYIVNAPYIFSSCWKIMDYTALPQFCRRSKSGSSRYSSSGGDDCFSFHHPFHQQLYNHIKRQACKHDFVAPVKQGSFHVTVPEPEPEGTITVETIESELHKIGDTMNELKIGGA